MIARTDPYLVEPATTATIFNGVYLTTSVSPANDATSGGDWCDVLVVSDDVVALSIGDVCGHGPALHTTKVAIREAVTRAAFRGLDPAQTLADVNRFVCDFATDLYATALLALLDTRRGTMSFANAGHPPILMIDSLGGRYLEVGPADLPLGIETFFLPTLHHAATSPSALVVLYTDGITEYDRRPLDGEAKLLDYAVDAYVAATPTASRIAASIFDRGRGHDDAAILAAWLPSGFADDRKQRSI